MSAFTIIVDDNQSTRVTRRIFKEDISGVRMSTTLPGGCAEFSFRVYDSIRFVPNYLGFNFRVTAQIDGEVLWAGRMDDFTAHRDGSSGEYWEIVARGFGINVDDKAYTSISLGGGVTDIGTLIENVITAINAVETHQIDATSVQTTGITLAGTVDLVMVKAATAIKFLSQFGNTSLKQVMWYVYPDSDGTIRFTFTERPTTPDLITYADTFESIEFGLSGRQLANKVTVLYSNGTLADAVANDTDLQSSGPVGWGVTREAFIALPEITVLADAQQAADSILAQFSIARLAASSITLKPNTKFYDTSLLGQEVPLYKVRSGQLVQMADIDSAEGGTTNLSFNNSFMIAGTEWDEDNQTLTIRPESYDKTLDFTTALTRSMLVGRVKI